jgi:transcription-repair coupling factor (superfamily II helicase)
MEYNELGGGFKLAMSDLQIRGGGNLLGVSQSGHIAAIGYDLYLELLQKTVADLRTSQQQGNQPTQAESVDPEIHLNISAYIPESYIKDIGQRYIMYRRIAAQISGSDDSIEDLREELCDRYGEMPAEVENLFGVVAVKKTLIPLRISKLERGPGNLVFSFMEDTPVNPRALLADIEQHNNGTRLTPDGRLVVETPEGSPAALYQSINTIATRLSRLRDDQIQQ